MTRDDTMALPDGGGLSSQATAPEVAAVPASIPSAWLIDELETGIAKLQALVAEEESHTWRRYWDGYHTAYSHLLNMTLAYRTEP